MNRFASTLKNTTRESIIKFHLFHLVLTLTFLFPSLVTAEETARIIPEVNLHPKKAEKNQVAQTETTSISRQRIANSPLIRLTDLLKQEQSIARIESHSGDSTQTAVSIRGFGDNASANSLILIDGFPLTNPSLLAPNLNALLLTDIERIDIFQGSEGSLWGDQAVGGVVNIITRHPHQKMMEGKIGLGTEHTRFYSLSASNEFNHFDHPVFLKISGFTNQTDHYRQHNQQKEAGIFPEAGFHYARGSVTVRVQYVDDTIYFPGGLTETQYHQDPAQAVNFSNFSHYQTERVQLFNQHAINADWLLETRLSHEAIKADGLVSMPFDRHEGLDNISPRLIGTLYKARLVLGFNQQFQYYQFENHAAQKKSTGEQQDVFAQINVPFYPDWHFTLGARAAQQNNLFQENQHGRSHAREPVFVTEQGLLVTPAPALQFFLRRDGNFRFPKSNENLWHAATTDALHVQKGVSYETGGSWQTNNQKTQVTIYQLSLQNEIAFDPEETPAEPFGSFRHLDPTRRLGITLAENYQVSVPLTLDAQLNYVNARFASGVHQGKWIPAVPAWNANIGPHYQLAANWQVSYTALYTGSRFPSEDEANAAKKVPAYWLHNAAVQYTRQAVKVSLEIANIGNQRYATYTVYQPAAQSALYYPGAGRSYLLTVDFNLI